MMLVQFSSGAEGFDTGNAVHLDKFAVSLVPDPATFGLCAVGALAGLRRRR
jgi:MYXO-CTERM domain-containing protein